MELKYVTIEEERTWKDPLGAFLGDFVPDGEGEIVTVTKGLG